MLASGVLVMGWAMDSPARREWAWWLGILLVLGGALALGMAEA